MRRSSFLRLGLISAIVMLGHRANALTLRLDEALEIAHVQNPSLQAATTEIAAAEGRRRQAVLLLPANPVLSIEGGRHTVSNTPFIDRGIGLAQELEIGGQRGLRVAGADHDVERAESVRADRYRIVDGEVRRAFFNLGAAGRRHEVARNAAALAVRLRDAARHRLAAGDASAIDLDLATVEAARTGQALALAETERERAATRLAAALGIADGTALEVAGAEAEPPLAAGAVDELVERALEVRPDLLAAGAERRRVESQADLVHRSGHIPNVTVRGFYRTEVGDERIAGAELSVPLPLWNREQGTEAALRAGVVGAAVETERIRQDVVRQVRLAYTRFTVAMRAWTEYARAALPAVNQALARLEEGYRQGYLALPEVLVQEDRLVRARDTEIAIWLETREAEADLIEAVGDEAVLR